MSTSMLLITIVFLVVVGGLPLGFSADQRYEKCLSSPLRCGAKVFRNNTTYPFWGTDIDKPVYCGQSVPFKLSCDGHYQTPTIVIANLTLRVVSTNLENKTVTVADESLFEDDGCPTTLDFNGDDQFTLDHTTEKMELHNCSGSQLPTSVPNITCKASNGVLKTYSFLPPNVSDHDCVKAGEVPVLESAKEALHESKTTLMAALKGGFEVRYIIQDQLCRGCSNSTGVCGSDSLSGKFRCLCTDRPHKSSCKDEG